MRASLVVVFLICLEQLMKARLAKHNNMIKAIPPDRSDQSLRTSVLPWRPRCNRPITDAHRSQPAEDDLAVEAITVPNDVTWRPLPPVCLGQLAGNPFRG